MEKAGNKNILLANEASLKYKFSHYKLLPRGWSLIIYSPKRVQNATKRWCMKIFYDDMNALH